MQLAYNGGASVHITSPFWGESIAHRNPSITSGSPHKGPEIQNKYLCRDVIMLEIYLIFRYTMYQHPYVLSGGGLIGTTYKQRLYLMFDIAIGASQIMTGTLNVAH